MCWPRRGQREAACSGRESTRSHNFFVLWPICTKLDRRGTWVHEVPPAKFEANPPTFNFLATGAWGGRRRVASHGGPPCACLGGTRAKAALPCHTVPKTFLSLNRFSPNFTGVVHGSMGYRLQSLGRIRQLSSFRPLEPREGAAVAGQPARGWSRQGQRRGVPALAGKIHSPQNFFVIGPISTKLHRRGTWVHKVPPAKFEANPTTFKFSSTGAQRRRRVAS